MTDSEKKSELVPGIETIRGLIGEPPMRIEIPFKLLKSEELTRQRWNPCYVAVIFFCFKCREPLVWHRPPRDDDTVFHCPKCNTRWTMQGAKTRL